MINKLDEKVTDTLNQLEAIMENNFLDFDGSGFYELAQLEMMRSLLATNDLSSSTLGFIKGRLNWIKEFLDLTEKELKE